MTTGAGAITRAAGARPMNPLMAARGLRSAAELADGKPCGTRLRYYAGCRCNECRAANTRYERERMRARARGEANGLVNAAAARAHLAALSRHGIGKRTAADAAKVALSIVAKIISGERQTIRAQTERRLLSVTAVTAADGAIIDAAPSWELLDELIACGYSRARLASELLGRPVRALQISRHLITVRNAARVRRVYERLRLASKPDTKRGALLVREMRAEGYRPDRIEREVAALAAERGWPAPRIVPDGGGRAPLHHRLRQQEVELLRAVFERLVEDGDV